MSHALLGTFKGMKLRRYVLLVPKDGAKRKMNLSIVFNVCPVNMEMKKPNQFVKHVLKTTTLINPNKLYVKNAAGKKCRSKVLHSVSNVTLANTCPLSKHVQIVS